MSFFLFPGQGSQRPGMGRDFYDASPAARETLDEAGAVLGDNFLDTIFNGTDEQLRDTRTAQVGLVAVEVAIARHLIGAGIAPDGCAGHSVGEIAALTVAGSLDFAEALLLTRERARLMAEETPEGGMFAVMGMDAAAIEAALPEGAEVANYNGPQQTIVSGATAALDAAADALKAAGAKRVIPLRVSGPFHSWCMARAAEAFKEHVAAVSIAAPRTAFVSSVSGQAEGDADTIRELLWKQLAAPVRWTQVMLAVGEADAIEAGPGNVLQGLAKRTPGGPSVRVAGTLDAATALANV